MQTGKERTLRALEFRGPDKIPLCLCFDADHALDAAYGREIGGMYRSDMIIVSNADPEFSPKPGDPDEWGCVWGSMGHTMGEVQNHPLEDWENYDSWARNAPDYRCPRRYDAARRARRDNPDAFLIGGMGMMMESIINFRGFQNYMTDLYLERENLDALIDLLYAKADEAIDMYADAGLDAVIAWEDWGLQDRAMMRPELWREIFKGRMARMIRHVHERGMKYLLHSCGYILDLTEDFIEMGVDALQLDQQRNMGLKALAEKTRGRICLWCPPDIQFSSRNTDIPALTAYWRQMLAALSAKEGGFMYKSYPQPEAIEMPLQTLKAEIRFFADAQI